ncbi:glycosyltransferase [Streptococcus equinus]|uniref:glycosyltransferase family A protein n=1 Tax=Streptococcus equinus TaxID=1335 RepID=UPI0012F728A8|nr:glycosyltransferase family A protein [Streptococcus equinus]QGX47171.1 glycosyltransferase [Streptococcus equinus]
MNENKHTIAICAYGESSYLEECIRSVEQQTVSSDVYLYTSTPNDYIKSIAEKHHLPLYVGERKSIGADWNQALSHCKTTYATIVHQDDLYDETFTEKVMISFEKHPDSTITYTDYHELKMTAEGAKDIASNQNLKIKRLMLNVLSACPGSKWWRNRVLSFGNPICCPSVSYNMSKLSDFEFDEEMKTSLDWYAWYTISTQYKGRFSYIKEPLMFHRIHEESETTATISNNTRTNEDLQMYQLLWPKAIANFLIKFYQKSQNSNQ